MSCICILYEAYIYIPGMLLYILKYLYIYIYFFISVLATQDCALQVCSEAPNETKPFVLVDGNFIPPGLSEKVEAECVIGGDGLEYCIAAASIIAKVTRDRLMVRQGEFVRRAGGVMMG